MINLSDYKYAPSYTELAIVVVNEQEIGVLWRHSDFYRVTILSAKIGGHNPKNGPIVVTDFDKIRLATRKDFEDFRLLQEDFDKYVADCYQEKQNETLSCL